MSVKLEPATQSDKRIKKSKGPLTIQEKLNIIERFEFGDRQIDIARDLKLSPSTISQILLNADKIKIISTRTETDYVTCKKKIKLKLTLQQKVDIIKRIKDGQRRCDVSKILNVPQSTISYILKNAAKLYREFSEIENNIPNKEKFKFKKYKKPLSILDKMDILKRLESGVTRSDIARIFNLPQTTISYVLKNADRIKRSYSEMPISYISKTCYIRSEAMEKMEKSLVKWIAEMNRKKIIVTQAAVKNKAKSLFDMENNKGKRGKETFAASRGWFKGFQNWTACYQLQILNNNDIVDSSTKYLINLRKIIKTENYMTHTTFNLDETGLHWKRLPGHTYIDCDSIYEKDRVSVLLCGNATGTLKLKPLVVYHTETPAAIRHTFRPHLPVVWRSNENAMITQTIFTEWYTKYFCPEVVKFCTKHDLPKKVILVFTTASNYSLNLEDINNMEGLDVKVMYLPGHVKSSFQPFVEGVINAFKAYYLRSTLRGITEAVHASDTLTATDFWKAYNILKATTNISKAWKEVSGPGDWWKSWPKAYRKDLNNDLPTEVMEDITIKVKNLNLGHLNTQDLIEWVESHREVLSKEDLKELIAQLDQDDDDLEKRLAPLRSKIEFPIEFQQIIAEGQYTSHLVFNVDETGLYWKRMPRHTSLVNHSIYENDRVSLLMGSNAAGSFKLKPLITPASKGVVKTEIQITEAIFSKWYTSYFCPQVAEFCAINNFPKKVLLVLDTSSSHPPNLEDLNIDELDVKVVYLPADVMTTLQPLGLGVIKAFKANYLRATIRGFVQASNVFLPADYWQSYNILKAMTNILTAWDDVSNVYMTSSWCKLWPEIVSDFPDKDPISEVTDDITAMVKKLDLGELYMDDISDWVESHGEVLKEQYDQDDEKKFQPASPLESIIKDEPLDSEADS